MAREYALPSVNKVVWVCVCFMFFPFIYLLYLCSNFMYYLFLLFFAMGMPWSFYPLNKT